jgi:hypothetical protein
MEAILYFSSKYPYLQNFPIWGFTMYLNIILSNTTVLFTFLNKIWETKGFQKIIILNSTISIQKFYCVL